MHINVNGGHSYAAPGASGHLDEVACDREIKDALISILQERGHTVSDSTSDARTPGAVLREQATSANQSGCDLAISIHLNAGDGNEVGTDTGTEVWYFAGSDEGYNYAQSISDSVSRAMGLTNRGAKSSSGLYWLNSTRATAVLIEVCFVDRVSDYDAYHNTGAWGIASAIADAVVGVPAAQSGWLQGADGRWWWRWDDGTYPAGKWQAIDDYWYLFDNEGWMLTGWQEVDGKWYYLADNGVMQHSTCIKGANGWYVLGSDGAMLTGGIQTDEDGVLQM